MALDKVLIIYDEQGVPVDYDILAKDVKFQPDGKDLPTKLAEMEQEIEDAAGGGYAPPAGGIPKSDLASGVQSSLDKADTALQQSDKTELQNEIDNKVDKENGKGLSTNDYTNEDKAAVATIASKANSADVYPKSQTYNKSEVDTALGGKLGVNDVSVQTPTTPDGTFTIHVGETEYTINLNHTHENMAKIVKCTEATLPQTLANDTIYVQVDDLTTPSEIESLWLFGLEFTGGGAAPGTPAITKPSGTTLNLGENSGSGVSKTITIKANSYITGDLTVAVTENSDLSLSYGQLTGQSSVTIPQASAIVGAQVTVVYAGSGALNLTEGLSISGGGASSRSYDLTVDIATVSLAAVKLTGSQWLQTDYVPGPNTEFSLKCKFTENSNTNQSDYDYTHGYFLCCPYDGNKRFSFYNGLAGTNPSSIFVQIEDNASTQQYQIGSDLTLDNSYLNLVKGTSGCTLTFLAGGNTPYNLSLPIKSTSMSQPMAIGYLFSQSAIYGIYDLTIYELIISENGVEQRHYVPQSRGGVPGLYDTVTGAFISSETATELVAIPLT